MRFQLNLAQKFIAFLLLTSVLPLLLVGVSSYQVARRTLQEEAINYTSELVNNQKEYLELQLQQIENLIANISNVDEIIKVLDSKSTTDSYTNLATKARIGYILNGYTNLQGLVSIDIFTMHGVHYHVGDTLNVSELRSPIKNRILVQTIENKQRIVWVGIEENVNAKSSFQKVVTAAKLLTVTNPKTLQPDPLAMILVNYSADYLHEHFQQVSLGKGSYLLVLDAQNRLIYHPDQQLIGSSVNPEFVQLMSADRGTFLESVDGQKMLVTYVRSKLNNWVVLSLIPVKTLVAPTGPIGTTTVLALSISLPIVLIAAWIVSTRIVVPIRQITQRFEQFQAGSSDWQTPLPVRGQDEISELSTWFNAFSESWVARQRAEAALREGADRERGTLKVVERMRQTLDLDQIFNTTTAELQQLLKCDRVVIFLLNGAPVEDAVAISSAGNSDAQALPCDGVSCSLQELCLDDRSMIESWQQTTQALELNGKDLGNPSHAYDPRYICVPDIYANAALTQIKADLGSSAIVPGDHPNRHSSSARAYLIVPIFHSQQLWGLLVSYQIAAPRQWENAEINLVMHISSQLGIALQQAELLAQTQQQSADLEKARDAAEAASRSKSEFLANISHELRTPLNAILGFSEVMSNDQTLNAEHQDHLGIINHSGQHLLSLINDVLEMSKIEAGQITLNLERFNLYDLLASLEEMLRLKAVGKGLTLRFERTPDLPQYITADERKLRQILLNLLGNAIKFTQKGHVILRAQADVKATFQAGKNQSHKDSAHQPNITSAPPSLRLSFEVEDTGPGIASEEIEQLFQPFVQTRTGRQLSEGTGLGLAISRKFVELMGGQITVQPRQEQGSIFRFDIWVTPTSQPISAPPTEVRKALVLAPDQPRYRILIVDDYRENNRLLIKLLSPIGFELCTAQNGQEGVELWKSWRPHLILMDLRMPVMDGYEATKLIRAQEKRSQAEREEKATHSINSTTQSICKPSPQDLHPVHTVIIALTASAFEETKMEVLMTGCDDFLRKPIQRTILLTKLSEHLGAQYVQTESNPIPVPAAKDNDSLTVDSLLSHLSHMPLDWIKRLHESAKTGFNQQITDLIEQIPESHTPLAQAIAGWNYDFQVDKIVDLTTQCLKQKQDC